MERSFVGLKAPFANLKGPFSGLCESSAGVWLEKIHFHLDSAYCSCEEVLGRPGGINCWSEMTDDLLIRQAVPPSSGPLCQPGRH